MASDVAWTPKARAVLDAASELFYEHGISAVGVDTVAARAGVTKKTLYDRFGSKERLVVAYLTARDDEWQAHLDEELAAAGPDPRHRLTAVFTASASWARTRSSKGCSMINAHAEISDPAHPAYPVMIGQKRRLLALFTELTTAAGVPDPEAVAEQVLMLHEGAVVMDGMGVVTDAFGLAREAAADLFAS